MKAIAPLTGEKPTELQRAHIRQQKVAAQEQPAQEQPEDVYKRQPFLCPLQSYLERGARTDPDLKTAC